MIVDSSALLAIAFDEPEAQRFTETMADASHLRMSATNWLEASMVVERRGDSQARVIFDRIVDRMQIEVAPFTRVHAARARQAWRDYGKGAGHPAQLNFGDCMAYAFAMTEQESLLFKGGDFGRTDVTSAMAR